ncbi:hypothetical protein [Haloarchaeobius baliensis]|uniref:hypothetical protein n=1 Tax=Haloarchaeobius baliensis TaxID=1670458 RepID=UPI003F8824A3
MTTDGSSVGGRREFVCALAGTGLTSAVAGCLGGDDDGGDTSAPTEETVAATTTREGGGGATTTTSGATGTSSAGGSVTADVSLTVRSSRSNIDQFQTFQTTFEALELVQSDGTVIRRDATTMAVDLKSLGPGGSVDLFQASLPAGEYTEARLYLPIQDATLANGDDPEFERTVPASRQIRSGDPIELQSGSSVDFGLTIALLRIAGDGPWTYTLGWGVQ